MGGTPREGGVLLAQVHQLSGRVFARVLKSHGLDELSPAQGRIVYALWKRGSLSQKELSDETRLDKSTLALMLDRLEADGQVVRRPDPADARRRCVSLTPRNLSLHEVYAKASAEMNDLFYAGLGIREIERFERTLARIRSNLEAAERSMDRD
ncbi:MAG TPA: MarR family transcriptional regulator [Fibrobacteria bacterium]|nr:MarR family transcriptional regulator [Fibrobacteria bacterium]HOX51617.1 MarR family transcriptional regulator [Fibrobacteria bacterium]